MKDESSKPSVINLCFTCGRCSRIYGIAEMLEDIQGLLVFFMEPEYYDLGMRSVFLARDQSEISVFILLDFWAS